MKKIIDLENQELEFLIEKLEKDTDKVKQKDVRNRKAGRGKRGKSTTDIGR